MEIGLTQKSSIGTMGYWMARRGRARPCRTLRKEPFIRGRLFCTQASAQRLCRGFHGSHGSGFHCPSIRGRAAVQRHQEARNRNLETTVTAPTRLAQTSGRWPSEDRCIGSVRFCANTDTHQSAMWTADSHWERTTRWISSKRHTQTPSPMCLTSLGARSDRTGKEASSILNFDFLPSETNRNVSPWICWI